jgi:hypothetical protein
VTVVVKNVGAGDLSATEATLTSKTPGVSFPGGGLIRFAATRPLQTATATALVTLTGATGITEVDLDVSVNDPTLAFAGGVPASLAVRANYDEAPGTSASEDFEARQPNWTMAHPIGNVDWQRQEVSATNHRAFAPDLGIATDLVMVSPVLNVGTDADFTLAFSHAYAFETAIDPKTKQPAYFDGGVIEISTDGITWVDAGDAAGYPVTLYSDAQTTMPLKGRKAYGGASPDFPTLQRQTLNLGRTYAGKNVQVRFRVATDDGGAGEGWLVDDVSFGGITNTPFTTLVANVGCN